MSNICYLYLLANYNETVIRDESKIKEYLAKYFSPEELKNINSRNLFSADYSHSSLYNIKELAQLNDEQWKKLKINIMINNYKFIFFEHQKFNLKII